MSTNFHPMKIQFRDLANNLFQNLNSEEDITLNLEGEETKFVRFNQSKVRQATDIEQWTLSLKYQKGDKIVTLAHTLSTNFEENAKKCLDALMYAREEVNLLPSDPFITPVLNHGQSSDIFNGDIPEIDQILAQCEKDLVDTDLAGIFACGPVFRGIINSKGLDHWYQTQTFSFDYSLYFGDRAVKGLYAGPVWDAQVFAQQLKKNTEQLELLKKPKIKIRPGKYRCYLGPSAVGDIVGLMCWGGFGLGSFKRGGSPLGDLFENKKNLNPKFHVTEDFSLGLAPRFNNEGELSPEQIPLIVEGRPGTLLTSSRSALEYQTISNGASDYESPRSLSVASGELNESDVLAQLGTGLYLSNVHYLNWSDRKGGRFTGMTRFACFWVENGVIQGPIEDMRFDENLYSCFGEQCIDFTRESEIMPDVGTYESRHLGAQKAPGLLVKEFTFTL
jgi:predicted Zn-dependent protease